MNILIVHNNTPLLTECLVKSINNFIGTGCTIYVFDNSDKSPFTYEQDNVVLLDNTNGDLVNFENELRKYNGDDILDGWTYNDFKNSMSIDKCFTLINDNFIILAPDILLKKDISFLYNDNFLFYGSIEKDPHGAVTVLPYCCFINVNECNQLSIRYFNPNVTEAKFYRGVTEKNCKEINTADYTVSYQETDDTQCVTMTQWLYKYEKYWGTTPYSGNTCVIYTCLIGDDETLMEPSLVQECFDYVCFTDRDNLESNVWKFRKIPSDLKSLPKKKQKEMIKISPHKYFSEYIESLYIDSTVNVVNDIKSFIETYCDELNKCVFIRKHPNRNCIYKEAYTCIKRKQDTQTVITDQINRYTEEGYPQNYGLVESDVIYRKHTDIYCIELMDEWEEEVLRGSYLDQLSFNYCLWKIGDSGFKYIDSNVLVDEYIGKFSCNPLNTVNEKVFFKKYRDCRG